MSRALVRSLLERTAVSRQSCYSFGDFAGSALNLRARHSHLGRGLRHCKEGHRHRHRHLIDGFDGRSKFVAGRRYAIFGR